ncbi:RrF2 family transcriptional regulator [Novosphingobium cyanobacteriorum]|uniref:Rrf2 family transcriptional regulator n=1 Tax=Novosphingobium cyanobacteriorum TaxID=3024215 RepID=A0ABT6CGH1_9SPHN|nr:Rrf2 family transcriptional regulator [Novosphingobium cyanobacteriorum]MDF8333028.1 Rrf2 family transcriptional regulator [Novosphingobium cyanobacteriorum]
MQLTQHTDFGLRLLVALARDGGQLSLPGFAASQGISYHHVAKVAQALVREGLAVSQRGRSGGILLARPAAETRVGDAVRALEKTMRLVDCGRCALREDCSLSGMLAEAMDAFIAVLDRYTLADAARSGVPAFPGWAMPATQGTCAAIGD